ncbi:diaminopimelate epimerase [Ereboglobus sp. PH5-10]|uniref:diaminopimelate epimerase n=1 Tax=Ereboglobus sp. PH5-10 TaxID=2940629 RepID=UPI002404D0E5|nr:diaminopimelate epimerase [Ereboglobus sp. PH5-10]MDF9826828.1 diaminopimelate epimerase [Ereboglobus sp. PH5-10]
MKFTKYHALGNDYLVLDARKFSRPAPRQIQRICHRNFGLGSDGILHGPLPSKKAPFALRIFNPDGSEAEKSGNGLRIFARYLRDQKLVGNKPFLIETKGGVVEARVISKTKIRVAMGGVSFSSRDIPVRGRTREVLGEKLLIGGNALPFYAATVGNPHCVIPVENPTGALAREIGPQVEVHKTFPNRTNVQFLHVIDRNNIRIEIWERGAGYTLASGSSSSAAAAVAFRMGWCDGNITVHMPGGTLSVEITPDFRATQTGPVEFIGTLECK